MFILRNSVVRALNAADRISEFTLKNNTTSERSVWFCINFGAGCFGFGQISVHAGLCACLASICEKWRAAHLEPCQSGGASVIGVEEWIYKSAPKASAMAFACCHLSLSFSSFHIHLFVGASKEWICVYVFVYKTFGFWVAKVDWWWKFCSAWFLGCDSALLFSYNFKLLWLFTI